MKKIEGFTLIELMLVLVIIGTLATIILPHIGGEAKRSKIIAAQAEVENIGIALDRFELDAGSYPSTGEGLGALMINPGSVEDWGGPYLKGSQDKLKDSWSRPYQYLCPGIHNPDSYDLESYGPDGVDGGEDDIKNW